MGTESGYQGWENYETWLIALWLSNEEGIYRRWQERADELLEGQDGDAEAAKGELAEELAQSFDEEADEMIPTGTVFSDLIHAALGEVEWLEVAQDVMGDRLAAPK